MRVDHDLHIHTYLSACCSEKKLQTPRNIISLAEQMELQTIGFADHLWMNPDIPPCNFYKPQDESQITRLKQDLASIKTGVRVLTGCEADTKSPGEFSITREFAKKLDYVLLACSHIHIAGFIEQPKSFAPRDVAEHLVKMFLSAVKSGIPTVIAHPFALCGQIRELEDSLTASLSDAELFDAFSVAAKNNVAMEINASAVVAGEGSRFSAETPLRLITTAKKAGCKFTFGSDAHGPEAQKALAGIWPFINKAGITEKDILPLALGRGEGEKHV